MAATLATGLHQTGRKTLLVDIDQIPAVFLFFILFL
jgi:cellulose biosynthesis protein BcsQ